MNGGLLRLANNGSGYDANGPRVWADPVSHGASALYLGGPKELPE